MSAFFLFDIRAVNDPDKLERYKARVLETVNAHGGRYRVLGGPAAVLEGNWPIGTPVLIEFPTRDVAEAWYGSEAYGPLLKLRSEAADCGALIIDGCTHPPEALMVDR